MSSPTAHRADVLDALRGFALFGVAWINYIHLSFWKGMPSAARAALPGATLDVPLEWFQGLLIDGRFYSIFSMLFGIGFGFFLEKGSDGLSRFYRRMLVLLVIGWLHLRYLWNGDILFLYAVLGLMLPALRHMRDRRLLILAGALLLSPVAIDAVTVMTHGVFDPGVSILAAAEQERARLGLPREYAAIPRNGLDTLLDYRSFQWRWRVGNFLSTNRVPKVFALFLIGLWVSRRKLFVDPAVHRRFLQRVLVIGAAIGIPGAILLQVANEHAEPLPDAQGLWGTVGYALGVVPMAMAIASGFALLWTKERWLRILSIFAPLGRMALTNYLMQTIIALLLFTGIGLGLGTRVSLLGAECIALGVFIVQVIWSKWWLERFRYGPMEWLWRVLTYGRLMPFRK